MGVGITGGKREERVVQDIQIVRKVEEIKVPKFVEYEVKVPHLVYEDIVIKKPVFTEEVIRTQTVDVEHNQVIVDRVTYKVIRPIFKDKVIEIPRVIYVEKIIEVPKIIEKVVIQEKPVTVEKPVYIEKEIEQFKIVYKVKDIEVPKYKDVIYPRPVYQNKDGSVEVITP
jgi:hypothetical protein